MLIDGVDGLIEDLKFAFGMPILAFVMLSSWFRRAGGDTTDFLLYKFTYLLVIAVFCVSFGALMYQDRAVLKSLWQEEPILYSFIYTFGSVAVCAGVYALAYWKLRPSCWRRK